VEKRDFSGPARKSRLLHTLVPRHPPLARPAVLILIHFLIHATPVFPT
jgi:hypothetical protein